LEFTVTYIFYDDIILQGNSVGQTGLGMMYLHGKGVEKVNI